MWRPLATGRLDAPCTFTDMWNRSIDAQNSDELSALNKFGLSVPCTRPAKVVDGHLHLLLPSLPKNAFHLARNHFARRRLYRPVEAFPSPVAHLWIGIKQHTATARKIVDFLDQSKTPSQQRRNGIQTKKRAIFKADEQYLSNPAWTRLSRSPSEDPLFPNKGRWLWNEQRKQQEHSRIFNLRALEDVVLKAVGPSADTSPVRLEKLAEGASNQVFLAVVGNQRAIVKIPDPVVPPHLATASEVARLDFLRTELDLPVPKVFAWNDSSNDPVGCEYIIMEEAQGYALNTVSPSLEISEKLVVVDEILSIQKRLIAARTLFRGFESLYFTGDTAKLGISHHLPLTPTGAQKYCIGPLAHQYSSEPDITGVENGPCEY